MTVKVSPHHKDMNMIRFGTVFSKFIVLGAHGNWIYWLEVTTRLRKLGAAISWSLFYLSHSFESSVAFTFALLKLSQSTLLFFAFLGFSPFWFLAFFLYFFLPPFLPFFLSHICLKALPWIASLTMSSGIHIFPLTVINPLLILTVHLHFWHLISS